MTCELVTNRDGPQTVDRKGKTYTVAHLRRALENGVTRLELIEGITHLAYYSGWPTAVNAVTVTKEVFSKS